MFATYSAGPPLAQLRAGSTVFVQLCFRAIDISQEQSLGNAWAVGNALGRHWARVVLCRLDLAEYTARLPSHAAVHHSHHLVDGQTRREAKRDAVLTRRSPAGPTQMKRHARTGIFPVLFFVFA